MKIAIILGNYSVGNRPLDFWYHNIWTSPRGLTGTDLTFVQTAIELKKLGNDVSIFTRHAQPDHKPVLWEGIKLFNIDDLPNETDDSFDAFISINEPDVFRLVSDKPVRILWQMLNDFPYCQPGWEDLVDQCLGVCTQHTEYLKKQVSKPEKWDTIPLGCSPEWYEDKRIPGRMIWCSSADRGLHWLLSEWPNIKKAVPYASLRVFYHFNFDHINKIEPNATNVLPKIVEMAQRVRYIKYAIDKLKHLDVQHVGSISRDQMKEEFNQASVFPFCCDTVVFSEGFSVSAMEAQASYTVPIITKQDCLGDIYKDSGSIMIDAPVKDHISEFTEAVIKSLTDKEFADNIIEKCRQFSQQYTWAQSAQKMENLIKSLRKNHG